MFGPFVRSERWFLADRADLPSLARQSSLQQRVVSEQCETAHTLVQVSQRILSSNTSVWCDTRGGRYYYNNSHTLPFSSSTVSQG
jgi:hypothetical protein